jgi:hypothetical protein
MPSVTATSWVNTTGRTWRADVTVGGVTRSSGTKDFGGYYTEGWKAYYTSSYWAKATAKNNWTAKIPKQDGSGSEDWDSGAATAYSTGKTDGMAQYYHSGYWKSPIDNEGLCLIPNITNTESEAWFSLATAYLYMVQSHIDGNNNSQIYGKLYYWDYAHNVYVAAATSNCYWFRCSQRLGLSAHGQYKKIYY